MLLVLAAMALIDFFDPVDTSLAQAVPRVKPIHSFLILAPVLLQYDCTAVWEERTQTQTHSKFTRPIKKKVLSGKPEYPNSKLKKSY